MGSSFRRLIPGLSVILVAVAFSVWAYPQLPERVATHFDIHGQANDWSSRLVALTAVPLLGVFIALLFTVLPKIDPRRANYEQFSSTYWIIANAALVLIAGVHVLLLGNALGWNVNMSKVASLSVGSLFVLLGNLMTRIRPNWFMGIRTPWTLSSDSVWRKTHRFGGVAFVISGLAIAASAFFPSNVAFYSAFTVAAVASLSTVVYSYIVWRQEQSGRDASGDGVTRG